METGFLISDFFHQVKKEDCILTIARDNYKYGMDGVHDCAKVVCPQHSTSIDRPLRNLHSISKEMCKLWMYRVGMESSVATCGVCGRCPIRLNDTNTHICHIESTSDGGNCDVDNLVLGSSTCNLSQGVFRRRTMHGHLHANVLSHRARLGDAEL